MSILDWLGLGSAGTPASQEAGAEAVRQIAGALEAMEPGRAKWLAAFSYLLGRVAHADLSISDEESRRMESIVRKVGGLAEDQAALVVEIAKTQNRLFGGTQNFLAAREFRARSTPEERHKLIDALFAVSAADDSISTREEQEIRLIASELGLSEQAFVEARGRWSDYRSVLRALGETPPA